MTAPGLRLVVFGTIGQMPLAGVAWQVLHYLEGFRRLGFAVYYVEDTGDWPYDPDRNTITDDPTYAINYLGALMARFGFSDRWAYRATARDGCTFGLSEADLQRLFEKADAIVNLTGSTVLRPEHRQVPVRIYLETDPVLSQIEAERGSASRVDLLKAHTHHFSYGENLGAPDCGIPVNRFAYRATRQPVVLDWWTSTSASPTLRSPARGWPFTTVANWRQSGKDVEWQGEKYTWSKHHEFLKFLDLPRRSGQPLELALAMKGEVKGEERLRVELSDEDAESIRLLTSHGWQVIDALSLSRHLAPYHNYILGSRGEFTVAKDQNVRLRSGWFSDRSACYLAAGRPVITQNTAFGRYLPTGEGLFAFDRIDDVLAAFRAVDANYERQRRAARAIAEECFKAETVLAKLAEESGLDSGG